MSHGNGYPRPGAPLAKGTGTWVGRCRARCPEPMELLVDLVDRPVDAGQADALVVTQPIDRIVRSRVGRSTERRTGPPGKTGRPEAHAPGRRRHRPRRHACGDGRGRRSRFDQPAPSNGRDDDTGGSPILAVPHLSSAGAHRTGWAPSEASLREPLRSPALQGSMIPCRVRLLPIGGHFLPGGHGRLWHGSLLGVGDDRHYPARHVDDRPSHGSRGRCDHVGVPGAGVCRQPTTTPTRARFCRGAAEGLVALPSRCDTTRATRKKHPGSADDHRRSTTTVDAGSRESRTRYPPVPSRARLHRHDGSRTGRHLGRHTQGHLFSRGDVGAERAVDGQREAQVARRGD